MDNDKQINTAIGVSSGEEAVQQGLQGAAKLIASQSPSKTAGNKAAGSVHNEVQLFLRDELLPLAKQNARNVYDLEAEYAKTKKNNSPFIPLVLLACFLVVGFGALLAVAQIRSRDGRIAVSLDVFDDVNLKNLIDTVSRTQDMYEQAVKNLSALQGDLNTRINEAELKLSSDIAIVDSMRLSKREAARRKSGVKDIYNKTVADIHTEYDGQITAASKEVEEYKARLAEYDNAKVKSAQERDKALDSERKLQSLERQKLVDKYEARIKKLEESLDDVTKRGTKDKTDAVVSVVKKYTAEIDELNKTIAERDATIAEREATIAEREATIAERDATIVDLQKKLKNLTNKLAASEAANAELSDSLDVVLKARGIAAVALRARNGKLYLHITREKAPAVTDGTVAHINFTPEGAKKSISTDGTITREGKDFVFTPTADKNGNIADINAAPPGTAVSIKD